MAKGFLGRARAYSRAVVFWDAEGTAGSNSRLFDTVLNQILAEMDGIKRGGMKRVQRRRPVKGAGSGEGIA